MRLVMSRRYSLEIAARNIAVAVNHATTRSTAVRKIRRYDWIAGFSFVFCFILFYPLMNNSTFNASNSILSGVTKSLTLQFAACSSLSMCFPLLIDLLLDYSSIDNFGHGYRDLRAVSLSSLIAYNFVYIATITSPNFFTIQSVCGSVQNFAEHCMLLWLLNQIDTRRCWRTIRIFPMIFVLFLWKVFAYCSYTIVASQTYQFLSIICMFIFGLLFLGISVEWLLIFVKERRAAKSIGKVSFNDYYCIVITLSEYLFALIVLILPLVYGTDALETYLGVYIMRSLFTFLICALPGRMLRFMSKEYENDSTIKTMFVKYISHHLRNPLGVISTGIHLLEADIQQKYGADESLLQSNIHDMKLACNEATEVLDNLSLYEQLAKMVNSLHTEDVNSIEFICKALAPVAATIRSSASAFNLFEDSGNDLEQIKASHLYVDKHLLGQQLVKFVHLALLGTTIADSISLDGSFISTGDDTVSDMIMSNKRRKSWNRARVIPLNAGFASNEYFRLRLTSTLPLSQDVIASFQGDEDIFTRDASRVCGGVGLSVWILRRVVEMHGGHVGYMPGRNGEIPALFMDLPFRKEDSAVEHNILTLPNFQAKIKRVPVRRTSKSSISIRTLAGPMNILIVDDSLLNRKTMMRLIHSLNHTCSQASDGDVAVDMVAAAMQRTETIYDVILMDNEMPVMRGRDAVKKIRDLGYKGVVLGVTGNSLQEDIDDFKTMGADEVLLKPLNVASFLDAISDLTQKGVVQVVP